MTYRTHLFEIPAAFALVSMVLAGLDLMLGDGRWGLFGSRFLVPALCYAVAYYYNELYDARIFGSERERGAVARALVLAAALVSIFYVAVPTLRPIEGLPVSILVAIAVIAIAAVMIQVFLRDLAQTTALQQRVLILGLNPASMRLANELCRARNVAPENVRFLREEGNSTVREEGLGFGVIGSTADLSRVLDSFRPTRIIVALAERRNRLPARQLLDCRGQGIQVESGVHAYERITGKLAIESLSPSDLLFSGRLSVSIWNRLLSRTLSFVAAIVGSLLMALPMLLIGLIVKLSSPGPILFVQDRTGLRGKPFRLLKFRTMREANRETSLWVVDNADRVTPVGYWLRKFRLDELPQFLNILRGDMNLIGPRPHPVSNHALFEVEIPYYSIRTMIPPGITGWAQVRNGYANDLPGEIEKMRYDLFYIANQSFLFDLHIFLKTIQVVLLGSETHTEVASPVPVTTARAEELPPPPTARVTPLVKRSDTYRAA